MSLIVALPILLTLFGYLWFFHHFYYGLGKDEYSLGLSVYHWNILLGGILPTVCVVLLLWKGALRFTFLATITPILLVIPVASMFPPVSRVEPEQRIIRLAGGPFPNGTDVYCNGVHLGQTPLEIRVGELKNKVAPWTAPPQQPWFQNLPQPLYTWYPWDQFERERYEGRKMLGRDDSVLQFDARAQYWWKFEFQGSVFTVAEQIQAYTQTVSYDDIGGYYPCFNVVALQPSVFAHRDVLADVMDKLDADEKHLWVEHVLKFYDLIGLKISLKVEEGRIHKEYFDTVARAAYGLSEQPTAEECRIAFEQMIEENDTMKGRRFLWTESATYFPWGTNVYPYIYRNNNGLFPRALTLAPRAIRQMGDASVEPLHALLEKYRCSGDERVPLLYAAQQQKNAILFGELARLYATTKTDLISLTANENALVVPLFADMLRRQPLCEFLLYGSREYGLTTKMYEVVESVDNPMLTPLIRAEFERLFSKYNPYDTESALTYYVMKCWMNEKTDRDELLRWVESLNIEQGFKDRVIKRVKTRLSFTLGDFQQGQIGIMLFPGKHPDLTFRQLADWLKENPEKMIEDFFVHMDPALNDAAKGKKIALLQILLTNQFIDDPDEAAEILRKVWADPRQRQDLMQALQRQFVVVGEINVPSTFPAAERRYQIQQQLRRSNDSSSSSSNFDSPINFGGLYGQFAFDSGSAEIRNEDTNRRFFEGWSLSKALYPIFMELDDEELCVPIARELAAQDNPEALDVLRKWSESENPRLKKAATETLHGLEFREKIRAESKALFLELATGKIQPDDLLPKPKPWVWREGRYVQE